MNDSRNREIDAFAQKVAALQGNGFPLKLSVFGDNHTLRFDRVDGSNFAKIPVSPPFTMLWAAERWLSAYIGGSVPLTADPEGPVPHPRPPAYHYNELVEYVEKKYGIKTRGFRRELDGKYRDFWHFLMDRYGLGLGRYMTLSDETGDGAEEWQQEILALFLIEFGNPIYVWVD